MLRRRGGFFVPRLPRRCKYHQIERKTTGYFTRSDKVTMMNGIECPTHYAYALPFRVHPGLPT